jgi:hypothetical protein
MNLDMVAEIKRSKNDTAYLAREVLTRRCDLCSKKEAALQRAAINSAPDVVPPIVHEVLASPGQPLDPSARAFMEPRFVHDFSRVRVHTDARANRSAKEVNALAYTFGRNIIFGEGQYLPSTLDGLHLLAHELVHVVQQGSNDGQRIERKIGIEDHDAFNEQIADRTSKRIMDADLPKGSINIGHDRSNSIQRRCSGHSEESYYRSAANYCRDTGFSGSLHPGQQCYREVPRRASYFECPPGDQVCFDRDGGCHDSYDKASTVESKNSDGSCNLHGLCFFKHAAQDIVPGMAEEAGRRQMECMRNCEGLPWYLKGFCMQGCTPGGMRR